MKSAPKYIKKIGTGKNARYIYKDETNKKIKKTYQNAINYVKNVFFADKNVDVNIKRKVAMAYVHGLTVAGDLKVKQFDSLHKLINSKHFEKEVK